MFIFLGNGKKVEIYDGRRSIRESEKDDDTSMKVTANEATEASMSGEIHYIRDSDDEHPDSDEDPDDDLDI